MFQTRFIALLVIVGLFGGVTACTQQTQQIAVQSPATLGMMAAQIEKSPSNMDAILSRNGHDRESFQMVVRSISEDPAKIRIYTDAYERELLR